MNQSVLFFLAFCLSVVLCLKPSPGCGNSDNAGRIPKQVVDTIHVTYNDKLLGPLNRRYLIQIPRSFDNTFAVPIVFDLHGYTTSPEGESHQSGWKHLGQTEEFIVVWPEGMSDSPNSLYSWNCSVNVGGPFGPTCDTDRSKWDAPTECHDSCPLCDEMTSCDWASCSDDIGFIDFVINHVADYWCIDMHQMHLTRISNGGMFAYYVATTATDGLGFATINPVAASPLVGFGAPPVNADINFSLIDFHGTRDDTIPYDETSSFGPGPHDSLTSSDGYYYEKKSTVLENWAQKMDCNEEEHHYSTPYDGQNNFHCFRRQCSGMKAILRCLGNYGHNFPLPHHSNVAAEVAYKFMRNHPRHE